MLPPQLVPGALLPPSMHVWPPAMQDVVPFLHALFGLVVQEAPAVQAMQTPEPLQTMLLPQWVPGPLLVPSMQVCEPLMQDVVPFLHVVGLPVQVVPAVQATQTPEPLQTMLLPQLTPGPLLVSSTQAIVPVEQEVMPFLQAVGFPPQEIPVEQAMQTPDPSHTMPDPQLVPPGFGPPLTHVSAPDVHDATPLKQMPGLPEQVCPSEHMPQKPFPSQTLLGPQAMPAMTLPVPSTQVVVPVMHEVTPFLQTDGFPLQEVPAVQATQLPEPLHTMLLPQEVPPVLGAPSTQVCTPVAHEVTPFKHVAPGFVVQGCPVAQTVHWPAELQTELGPQPVPGVLAAPSTQVCTPLMHEDTPAKQAPGLPVQA